MQKLSANHVAIIMDGNGRWAQSRSHSRFYGHIRGAKVAKNIIEHASSIDLKHLTLFAFSTENWFRPVEEVSLLMKLLLKQMERERSNLVKNNIQFHCIGELHRLPPAVQASINKSIEQTKDNTGLVLTFALSYSGRQDLTAAVRLLAEKIENKELQSQEINEQLLSLALPSSFLPDPDLIIRTSGESRLSNFFLWQAAYSEIYVTPKMWPEFTLNDFNSAINYYQSRERRFGRTSHQVHERLDSSALPNN